MWHLACKLLPDLLSKVLLSPDLIHIKVLLSPDLIHITSHHLIIFHQHCQCYDTLQDTLQALRFCGIPL